MSETLYSRRMGKKIAKLDPQRRSYGNEKEENMDGELQRFDVVKTCSDMWG